ncbi:MAG: hypothetical protein AAGB10_06860 [Pseudomonadota bacterium]
MLLDIVRFGHVIGIALGLGLAIYADGRFLRALSSPIRAGELEVLRAIHAHVLVAMGILWATGLILLYVRTGFVPSEFAPKLFFKVSVVTLLTVNAVLIGRRVMPKLERYEGFSFIQMPVLIRVQLSLIGAVSAACWLSLLALGVFQDFKRMSAGAIADVLQWFFMIPLAGAMTLALFAPTVFAVKRYRDRRRMAIAHPQPAYARQRMYYPRRS